MNVWNLKIPLFLLIGLVLFLGGCIGPTISSKDPPLTPRAGTDPVAVNFIQEGNRFFDRQDFREAARKYEVAIHAQSSVGEAHYNLGLALFKRGLYAKARPHFKKAVELEPFNPIIRNAPPFRKFRSVIPRTPAPESDGHFGHHH